MTKRFTDNEKFNPKREGIKKRNSERDSSSRAQQKTMNFKIDSVLYLKAKEPRSVYFHFISKREKISS